MKMFVDVRRFLQRQNATITHRFPIKPRTPTIQTYELMRAKSLSSRCPALGELSVEVFQVTFAVSFMIIGRGRLIRANFFRFDVYLHNGNDSPQQKNGEKHYYEILRAQCNEEENWFGTNISITDLFACAVFFPKKLLPEDFKQVYNISSEKVFRRRYNINNNNQ